MEPLLDPTGLCLRMIANKRRLLVHPGEPLAQDRVSDEPSYRSSLAEVLQKEYREVYLHPELFENIVGAIDRVIQDHLKDIVVKETIDTCVADAIQETLASQESGGIPFQW
jgi:hypothetical protein